MKNKIQYSNIGKADFQTINQFATQFLPLNVLTIDCLGLSVIRHFFFLYYIFIYSKFKLQKNQFSLHQSITVIH